MYPKKICMFFILIFCFYTIFLYSSTAQESNLTSYNLNKQLKNLQHQVNEKIVGQFNVIGTILIFIWLAGMIVFYTWAIRFYTYNHGLSKWKLKILYPEIFCRKQREKEKFHALQQKYLDIRRKEYGQSVSSPFSVPVENPYKNEVLGLPAGMIRSTFALTCLFIFLIIEGLNLISPDNLEVHYSEFLFILEMVFSFYFGSKVIDYLKKQKTKGHEKIIVDYKEPNRPLNEPRTGTDSTNEPV